MVQIIKTLEELQAELESEKNKGKLILLDFFATYVNILVFFKKNFIFIFIRWCGPCARIEPKIKDWSTGDFKDSVVFLKCDVDESEAVATEYNIESMPTFVFFKEGKEIHRVVGGNVEKLKSAIESKTSGKDTGENEDKDKDKDEEKDK